MKQNFSIFPLSYNVRLFDLWLSFYKQLNIIHSSLRELRFLKKLGFYLITETMNKKFTNILERVPWQRDATNSHSAAKWRLERCCGKVESCINLAQFALFPKLKSIRGYRGVKVLLLVIESQRNEK